VKKNSDDQYSKAEIERRFTAALGRALATPHKPHKPLKKAAKKAKKPAK
jgi:hypothetical protein